MTRLKLDYPVLYDAPTDTEASAPEPSRHSADNLESSQGGLRFGPFRLTQDGTLYRGALRISLPPKELAVLQLLVSNAGRIVPASLLRQVAWGETHVSPDSLPRCLSSLRALLDDKGCIATVYKRGYRFNLCVQSDSSVSTQAVSRHASDGTVRASAEPWIPQGLRQLGVLPRLAILPFTAPEGVPEEFRLGIVEETMLCLARNRTAVVDVLARDSVFSLAARGLTSQEVGQALHADLALTGRVTLLPSHLRLRAEMIRVADAVQILVEDFLVPRDLMHSPDAQMGKRVSMRILDTLATLALEMMPLAASSLRTAELGTSELETGKTGLYWMAPQGARNGTVLS